MGEGRARRRWITAGWIVAVLATALNGVVVGYGAIWLQFFGESADRDDYAVSAGGYGAAAIVLALAVPAILAHHAPRWLAWLAGSTAAILAVFALGSLLSRADAEQPNVSVDNAWDGVGGVLWAPWTWALIALGVRGLYRLTRGNGHEPD